MDRLSDEYLVRTNESLYSVQSMANIRIRLIFDSSNTLVNRIGPRCDARARSISDNHGRSSMALSSRVDLFVMYFIDIVLLFTLHTTSII